jgi:hypothetical protein
MAKTEVYSWRMNPEIKMGLEEEARVQGLSLAEFLDEAAARIIADARRRRDGDEAEQKRSHAAAAKCFGTIAGGDPYRSEKVSETVRKRLKARYGR